MKTKWVSTTLIGKRNFTIMSARARMCMHAKERTENIAQKVNKHVDANCYGLYILKPIWAQ